MDRYIGTLSKVTDRNVKLLLAILLQENQSLREEMAHIKSRKGPPPELIKLEKMTNEPNIITKTS